VLFAEVATYVRAALPPPPARLLEVGAGAGELARALRGLGYEVTAIDPASEQDDVAPVGLAQVPAEPASFDAAVAIVSLHHVEPLAESCARLGEVVRPGGLLVVDEFDVDRLDERAATWWLEHRDGHGAGGAGGLGGAGGVGGASRGHHAHGSPSEIVSELRRHLHGLGAVRAALAPAFAFGEPVRGAYLYRWALDPALRAPEETAIAAGRLPATGARFVAVRR